ncbi:acyltransferase family protein [Prauserella muralis]|uniref:Acyltransferase n=1 Tax=Prauserella muralis TaxID=588067 RepID=A0A2V4BB99_9PSEU|nr:acyltransferase [Prauserella muralis]PXY32568.1 acyltransferase [Prauserella muralis]TWE23718.1 acyltransferase-like protein [Prauserella muralis]
MTPSQLSPPVTRDRFLDLVRAVAILAVVAQHWTMPVLDFADGRITTGNALTTPGWWIVTWLSQVMPLVFFAGGAANLMSLRRASSSRDWLATRLRRLLLPALPLLAVWLLVPRLLTDLGVPPQPVAVAGAIAAQLLWFLAVYLLTVLAAPLMAAAHRRFGVRVPLALACAAALVDIARFEGLGVLGYANAVFVWLAVHQLGFYYADGTLRRLSRRAALGLSAAGFACTALLVAAGPYAASMIGMPGAEVSNMSPPTLCLISLAVGQISLVLAARPALEAFAGRPAVRGVLGWAGPRFMSIYLWHMPALVVVSGVTVLALDYATPVPGTLLWLAALPAWLTLTGLVLTGLLRLFGRFEARSWPAADAVPTWQLVAAGLLGSTGLLGLAATGFAASPSGWAVLVGGAFLLTGKTVTVRRRVAAEAA